MTERSPDGFRVRASEGAEGTFSWRVVAKRKDIAGARLERVEVPKEPTLPTCRPQSTRRRRRHRTCRGWECHHAGQIGSRS